MNSIPRPAPCKCWEAGDGSARRLLTGELHSDILSFALLNYFILSDADATQLEGEYGISRERAERFIGLRSAPSSTHVLLALHGVLGYFRGVERWPSPFYSDGLHLRLCTPSSGLIFPVWRDHFRAWLHYRCVPDASPRWVSSSHLPGGSKAHASTHIVCPEYARTARACLLVSHALEAEAVAGSSGISVAAANGLPAWVVARQLSETWPELRAVTVDVPEPGPFVATFNAAGLRAEVML